MIIKFLNEVLRPYLTTWGVKYNKWYDEQLKNEESKLLSPVQIQRKYQEYDRLTSDLLALNENMIGFSVALHDIAFGNEKKPMGTNKTKKPY